MNSCLTRRHFGLGVSSANQLRSMMARPIVGITGNFYLVDRSYPVHATGSMNSAAISKVAGALPLMIPSSPELVEIGDLIDACDGFLFTGGRPNVHPKEYGEPVTEAHGYFDRDRDQIALPLIRACVERGQPVLGLCRGFQEFNVAFGGTLHPEIGELPGRMNHRMPQEGTLDEKFALRHLISLQQGGEFARIFEAKEVMVNSLHGQGIKRKGDRIVVEGRAPDGTEEAIRVGGAKGFALAVQWHPEYQASEDPVSQALFGEFGTALRRWKNGRQLTPASSRLSESPLTDLCTRDPGQVG